MRIIRSYLSSPYAGRSTRCWSLCALLLIAGNCGIQQKSYAVFQFVAGEVYVLKEGHSDRARRARIGDTAGPHDVIQTRKSSAAELNVQGMGIVRLGENSRLKLGDLKSGKQLLLQLDQGRAGFLIQRLDSGAAFRVATPTMVASVRGTQFLVGVYDATVGGTNAFSKVAMFDGALELAANSSGPDQPDVKQSGDSPAAAAIVLDRPGEVRLRPGQALTAASVQALSAESQAEMKALEEMTSPAGVAQPDAQMVSPTTRDILPDGTPVPLPANQ